ncbi:MAG: energy transducer TonB [Myxococcota bacterium]
MAAMLILAIPLSAGCRKPEIDGRPAEAAGSPSQVRESKTDSLPQAGSAEVRAMVDRRANALASQCKRRETSSEPAQALVQVPPKFPDVAIQNRLTGRVLVEGTLTREGRIENPRVIAADGAPVFNEAALVAFQNWRFCPLREGEPDYSNPYRVSIPFLQD